MANVMNSLIGAAVGAGAEMRIALGTAVFWGMIGVTLFGLVFTPVFYVVIRKLFKGDRKSTRLNSSHQI